MARLSISRVISRLAERDPDRVVAVAGSDVLTAARLDSASNRYARALLGLGVARNDLVAITAPNGLDFVIACAGIWKAGATPQPFSTGLAPGERAEIERVARPSVVIGVDAATQGIASLPAGWLPQADLDDGPLADAWADSWKAPTSSGSTGRPKIVVANAPALLDPEQPVSAFLPLAATQLVAAPMTHSAAFTYAFRGLMTGHTLVILPRFDERDWVAAVERHEITWALIVPTMMHRILRLPPAERDASRLRSLETVLHLGAPCAPALKRDFLTWIGAHRVVEVYAGTESNGLTMIRGDEWLAHPGSVGRPIGGTELRVLRADGTDAAPGETGEIWMRRERLAYHYLGAAVRSDSDGWDTLGDCGFLDADGYLHVRDRADDLILRGGVNVYPVEIERALEAHPAVRSDVAYGVSDADLGQRIEAVADIADSEVDVEELKGFLVTRLDPTRRPARISLTRQPLRDDAGKVRRRSFLGR